MSKRRIARALKSKGLECAVLEYNWQATPGEMVSGWDIELTADSEERVAKADPDFDDWQPDCFNSADAIDWVNSLPNVTRI